MILLDSNYLFSIIMSLLLINGFYNLSYKFRKKTDTILLIDNYFISTIINYFFLINFLAVFTFNFLLFVELNNHLIKLISLIVIFFGFHKPTYLLNLKKIFKKKNYKENVIYIILFFYFILSLNPITDADSLDYHLTIPYYQIEFGNAQFYKNWMHSQLVGSGESIFLYSIVLGGLHFSQLLQFTSLLFIILIIINFKYKKIIIKYEKRLFICLSLLTMPVLIFLISTSKPQLFPITTNFLSLILVAFYLKDLKKQSLVAGFSLIIFLLFSSTQMKFSFLLSSGLITLFAFYQILDKKFFFQSVFIICILFLILIVPREVYEFINFQDNFFYNFFNPVSDPFGADAMNASLRHGTGNSRYLIFWLFFPYDQYGHFRIGEITYCVGPFALYFLFNYNLKSLLIKKITLIYLIFFAIALNLAQPVGRFYVEIFIWMLFFSILYSTQHEKIFQKVFQKVLIIFSCLYLIVLGYFSLDLFKGNFSKKYQEEVLSKNADGYLLYKWANEVIPENSVIISTHRASAFYKHEVAPYEFRLFGIFSKEGYAYYLKDIMKKNPKYILYQSNKLNDQYDVLKNCRGELFKFKKNVGYDVSRNPFTLGKNKKFYDGYIYKISNKDIKECLK